jgi:hypothetical protein
MLYVELVICFKVCVGCLRREVNLFPVSTERRVCTRVRHLYLYLTVCLDVSIRKSDALYIKTLLHLVWFSYARNSAYEAYTLDCYQHTWYIHQTQENTY